MAFVKKIRLVVAELAKKICFQPYRVISGVFVQDIVKIKSKISLKLRRKIK